MTPKELRSLMARTRTTSGRIATALGISGQQVRRWRTGTRPIPKHHLPAIEKILRDAGATSAAVAPRIDPRDIPAPTVENRISIGLRDDIPAGTGSMVDVVNSVLGALFANPQPQPAQPPAPAAAAVVRAMPTRPPAPVQPVIASRAGICQSPRSDQPGAPPGTPCQQLAMPGSRLCALHAVQERALR